MSSIKFCKQMLSSKDKNLVFVQTKEIIGLKNLKVDDK